MSENELKLRICLTTSWNFNFLNVKITLGLPNNLICEVVPKEMNISLCKLLLPFKNNILRT